MSVSQSIFDNTPAARKLAASPHVQRNADLSSDAYKARMRSLLWSTVPETFLEKKSDGTPNPEYNRSDPRVTAQDARRIVTLSKRLTDFELSLAPPQHVPDVGEMTKRLGLLHSYALVEPCSEGRTQERTGAENSNDDDDDVGGVKLRERGMTVERRRQERWLRLQRQKREAQRKLEEESKATKRRGNFSGVHLSPLSSKVISDHKTLREREAQMALQKQEAQMAERQKDMLSPPSSLLSSKMYREGYHKPAPQEFGSGQEEQLEERDASRFGRIGNKNSDTKVRHHHGRKSPPAGILQPPEGSPVANASGFTCHYVNSERSHANVRIASRGRRRSIALSSSLGEGSHAEVSVSLVPRCGVVLSDEQKAVMRQQVMEEEAAIMFKIANGKSPIIFRNLRTSSIVSDAALEEMRKGAVECVGEWSDTESAENAKRSLRQSYQKDFRFCDKTPRHSLGALPSEVTVGTQELVSEQPPTRDSITFQDPDDNPYGLRFDPMFRRLNERAASSAGPLGTSGGSRRIVEGSGRQSQVTPPSRTEVCRTVSPASSFRAVGSIRQSRSSGSRRGVGGLGVIMAAATGRNMAMNFDNLTPRGVARSPSPSIRLSAETRAESATGATHSNAFDDGEALVTPRPQNNDDLSATFSVPVRNEHEGLGGGGGCDAALSLAAEGGSDARDLAVFPPLSAEEIDITHSLRRSSVQAHQKGHGLVAAPMDPCFILTNDALGEDLMLKLKKRERRRRKRLDREGLKGRKDQITNYGSSVYTSDSGEDSVEGTGSEDAADSSEDSRNKAPKRRMLRAPKQSRWMKSFDTALMVSEALHFVEASRSKPPVVRCSPTETVSKRGELSARAVIPAPLRLSVPVKHAQETREKLELTHMRPLLTQGGENALRVAYSIRSPSRDTKLESSVRSTTTRSPSPAALAPDFIVLPTNHSDKPGVESAPQNPQDYSSVCLTSSPQRREGVVSRLRQTKRTSVQFGTHGIRPRPGTR